MNRLIRRRKKPVREQKPRRRFTSPIIGDFAKLHEAKITEEKDGGLLVEAVLISEGPGNEEDKNYYTRGFIESFPGVANGKKCFADHPTATEEQDHPERSTKDVIGFWKGCKAEALNDGRMAVIGFHKVPGGVGFARERALLKEAVQYANEFPNECLVGYSINADGVTEPYSSKSHGGDGELDGEGWTAVTEAAGCFSIDLVTFPGARGEPLSIKNLESVREAMRLGRRKNKFGSLLEKIQALSKSMPKGVARKDLKELATMAVELDATVTKELEEAVKTKIKKKAKEAVTPTGAHPELTQEKAMKCAMSAMKKQAESETATEAEKAMYKQAMDFFGKKKDDKPEDGTEEAEGDDSLDDQDLDTDGTTETESESETESETEEESETESESETETESEDEEEAGKGPKESARIKQNKLREAKVNQELSKQLRESKSRLEKFVIEKKLKESGLPESCFKMLKISLAGKSEKAMDAFLEAKKEEYGVLLEGQFGTHAGAREEGGDGEGYRGKTAAVSILKEAGFLGGQGRDEDDDADEGDEEEEE